MAGCSGVPATISLHFVLKVVPIAKMRSKDVLCSKYIPCSLQNEEANFLVSLTKDNRPLGIFW